MRPLGVYVHFPWCRARCPYCDFAIAIAPLGDIPHRRYADAILRELAVRAARFAGRRLATIYFGGGTPALWEPAEIARVIGGIRSTFPGAPEEVTVEANPLDCAPERLAALRAAGVTRLSVGTQSFSDGELVQLGRDHGAGEAERALGVARAAGFAELSADLIYALPGRDLDAWRATLARAIALAPPHLSVYQLTIEPATPFGAAARAGRLVAAPDDDAATQFEEAHARLGAAGYEHYEVSSYALPGHRARHNSGYWRGDEYLGLGNGAHSFWREGHAGLRWSAARSVKRWLAAAPTAELDGDPTVAEVTRLGPDDLRRDDIWTGLRTSDGIARELLVEDARDGALAPLLAAGLVTVDATRVRPTARGLLFADEIGARLLQ